MWRAQNPSQDGQDGNQTSRFEGINQVVGAMKGFELVRLAAGAAALVVIASTGASAQEGVLAKNILGSIGIIPKDPPQIDYRQRAPLVLPSKTDLPPPVPRSAVESRSANWPKDPDVLAARKEAADDALPAGSREIDRLGDGKRLSVEEMRQYRRTGGTVTPQGSDRRYEASRLSPEELKLPYEAEAKLDANKLERRYLSDPPQSLLNAAAGAPLKASADPKEIGDPDSPTAFHRQQQRR
jgi:hypothetical protein